MDHVDTDLWQDEVQGRITTVVGGAYNEEWSWTRLCDAHERGVRFLGSNSVVSGDSSIVKCVENNTWGCFENVTDVVNWITAHVVKVASKGYDGVVFDQEDHSHDYTPLDGTPGQPFYDAYGNYWARFTGGCLNALAFPLFSCLPSCPPCPPCLPCPPCPACLHSSVLRRQRHRHTISPPLFLTITPWNISALLLAPQASSHSSRPP